MKRFKCGGFVPKLPEYNPLIGCDGEPHSTSFLEYLVKLYESEEDYEKCKLYHDEIVRRSVLSNN